MAPAAVARFMRYVEVTEGCWLWTGGTKPAGYGRFWVGGRHVAAHRFAYEAFVGPIPEGLTIDHVKARGCTSTACVNPDHLEAVTLRENIMRGDTLPARQAAQTHCKRGHPLDGARLYRGKRCCRTCARLRHRAERAGLRGAAVLAQLDEAT